MYAWEPSTLGQRVIYPLNWLAGGVYPNNEHFPLGVCRERSDLSVRLSVPGTGGLLVLTRP